MFVKTKIKFPVAITSTCRKLTDPTYFSARGGFIYINAIMITMIMYDRANESRLLNELLQSTRAELILVYGRRRVGKSTLLRSITADKNSLYLLADQSKNVLDNLARQIGKEFVRFSNWDDLFQYILQSKYNIIVFDEFQYLYDVDKSWPSIMQRWWEKFEARDKKIILCGSIISTIYRIASGYGSPLYGRKTREIEVRPFRFKFVKDFLKGYSNTQLLETFSVVGGVPRYLLEFSPKKSLEANIKNGILDRTSFLYNEPLNLLYEEFRDPGSYMSILLALAQGHTRFTDIATNSGVGTNVLQKYLAVLERVKIIQKSKPVTDSKIREKNTRYEIYDHFFRFWFKFVFRNQSALEADSHDVVMDIVRRDFNSFVGKAFEQVCREHIEDSGEFEFSAIGRWWRKDKEIDLVAINDLTKEILLGECKWKDNVEPWRLLNELKDKTKLVEWNNDKRKEKFILFAKSFSKKIQETDVRTVTLDDLI